MSLILSCSRALNISQPTLTRSIQALESRLGAQLFDRKARTVLPTPVGEEMLKHARLVVASSMALEEDVQIPAVAGHIEQSLPTAFFLDP